MATIKMFCIIMFVTQTAALLTTSAPNSAELSITLEQDHVQCEIVLPSIPRQEGMTGEREKLQLQCDPILMYVKENFGAAARIKNNLTAQEFEYQRNRQPIYVNDLTAESKKPLNTTKLGLETKGNKSSEMPKTNLDTFENISVLIITVNIITSSTDLECQRIFGILKNVKVLWKVNGTVINSSSSSEDTRDETTPMLNYDYINGATDNICKFKNEVQLSFIEVPFKVLSTKNLTKLIIQLAQDGGMVCGLPSLGKPGEIVQLECEPILRNDSFDITKELIQTILLPLLNTTGANENVFMEEYLNLIPLNKTRMPITTWQKNSIKIQSRVGITQDNVNNMYVIKDTV